MKKWICAALAALTLLLCGCSEMAFNQYARAQKLYEAGDYAAAAVAFGILGDYQDSAQMSKVCKYATAEQLLAAGDFDKAAKAFKALGDYEDSPERVLGCRYAKAEAFVAEGKLEEAQVVFEGLEDYKDSPGRAMACRYALAQGMLERKEYLAAAEAFAALGNYADAMSLSGDARWLALQEFISRQDQAVTVGDVRVHISPVENDPDAVSIWAEKTQDLGFYTVTDSCGLTFKRGHSQAQYYLMSNTNTQSDGMSGYSRSLMGGSVELAELTKDSLLPLTGFTYYGQDVYGNVTQRTEPWIGELEHFSQIRDMLSALLEAAPTLLEQTGYTTEDFGLTGL